MQLARKGLITENKCVKAVEKIQWFGYNKEKVLKQERRKHYAGNNKNAVRSVYRNITEDIWKSFKDSNFVWLLWHRNHIESRFLSAPHISFVSLISIE